MHWKRVGSAGNAKEWATAHFWVSVRILIPCRDSGCSVMTGVSLARCFWVATKPLGSMSQHDFPCVAT